MAPTILIKFCGFIVHSNPNNMAQIKGSSHKKKTKNFHFLKNGSNDFV